jgi:hypothetical protein
MGLKPTGIGRFAPISHKPYSNIFPTSAADWPHPIMAGGKAQLRYARPKRSRTGKMTFVKSCDKLEVSVIGPEVKTFDK